MTSAHAAAGRMVYLSDYFGPGGAAAGGAGIAALQSYDAVREQGADAVLLAGYHAPDRLNARADVTRLNGEDLRAGSPAKALRAIYNMPAARGVADALSGFDPDTTVVVLHQWTRWLSPSTIGALSSFRLMIYMHDYFWACPNGAYYDFKAAAPCTRRPLGWACVTADCDRGGRGPKAVRLARAAIKALVERGDPARRLFLSISEQGLRTARRLLARETHALIHNPLPASPWETGSHLHPSYDVGYFGRLEPEKGVGDLLNALKGAGRSGVFVGSGSLAPQIAETLGAQALVEWAAHDDALALMRRCRVVVLPSRWPETWGLVVAEALAMGRPVVVSRRAGSAELVERYGGGRAFDPNGPGDLSAAVEAVLGDPRAEDSAMRAAACVQTALSPRLHGRRMVALARERWGLDVRRSAGSPPAAPGPLDAR